MKLVCPLGGAEWEERGQMGSARMEDQTLTAMLGAVKITKRGREWQNKEVKGTRGKGDEGRA